jgi:hypothetical protein
MEQSYRYDGTRLMTLVRVSPHISANLNNASLFLIELDCQTGNAALNGLDSDINPSLVLRLSKDGGQTFGLPRKASLGKTGKYRTRQRWHRFGLARDFVIEISCTDAVDLSILSAWMTLDVGTQ